MCHNVRFRNKKIKIVVTILGIVFLQSTFLFGQQESLRGMYPFMPMGINPGRAGVSGVASIVGIYRKKPLIAPPGLSTISQQYLSFDMPLHKGDWGLGFMGFNSSQSFADGSGAISSNLGIVGIVSKHFVLGEEKTLSLGGSVGLNQVPLVSSTGNAILKGSYGLGVFYNCNRIELGVSAPSVYFEGSGVIPIFGHAQYLMDLENGDKVRMGAVARRVGQISTKVDLYGVYWFQELVGLGIWYMDTGAELGNTALLGTLQIALGRKAIVNYGYDFLGKSLVINSFGNSSGSNSSVGGGFHQIGLRLDLDMKNGKYSKFRP